ncbi:MAG: hypothetical protein WBC97_08345 [Gemmatimonadales bacterium]
MPRALRRRRHVPHFEIPGGTVFLNWRLDRRQPVLSRLERVIVLDVIRGTPHCFGAVLAVVVMPDHVHALVTPAPGVTGRRLAVAWRGIAAGRLLSGSGRTRPIWQRGYFDRWKRTPGEIVCCIRYVESNPRRRWPGLDRYDGLWIGRGGELEGRRSGSIPLP